MCNLICFGNEAEVGNPLPSMKSGNLLLSLLASLALQAIAAADPCIIDPHTNFKGEEQIALESKTGKRRPKDSLGQVVVPEDYRDLADRLEIQSTLITEAIDQDQPQLNAWIFEQANVFSKAEIGNSLHGACIARISSSLKLGQRKFVFNQEPDVVFNFTHQQERLC